MLTSESRRIGLSEYMASIFGYFDHAKPRHVAGYGVILPVISSSRPNTLPPSSSHLWRATRTGSRGDASIQGGQLSITLAIALLRDLRLTWWPKDSNKGATLLRS